MCQTFLCQKKIEKKSIKNIHLSQCIISQTMETDLLIKNFKSKSNTDQDIMNMMQLLKDLHKQPEKYAYPKNRKIGSIVDLKIYVNFRIERYELLTRDLEKLGTNNKIVSNKVCERKLVLEKMKFDSQRNIESYKKNENLNKSNPSYQFCVLHAKILFEKKIYDVGTKCIVRYPGDHMTFDDLNGSDDYLNNFITITYIASDFIMFSTDNKLVNQIHKSDLFVHDKKILAVVSDFYVRHLRSKIYHVDYWILAIECMRLVINNQIYNVDLFCVTENCQNQKVGHLINFIHHDLNQI